MGSKQGLILGALSVGLQRQCPYQCPIFTTWCIGAAGDGSSPPRYCRRLDSGNSNLKLSERRACKRSWAIMVKGGRSDWRFNRPIRITLKHHCRIDSSGLFVGSSRLGRQLRTKILSLI